MVHPDLQHYWKSCDCAYSLRGNIAQSQQPAMMRPSPAEVLARNVTLVDIMQNILQECLLRWLQFSFEAAVSA